jgi:hypothetical protein
MALAGETARTLTALLRRFLTFIFGGERRFLTRFPPDTFPPSSTSCDVPEAQPAMGESVEAAVVVEFWRITPDWSV